MRQFYLSSAFLLLFFLAGCGNSTGKEAKAPDNLSAFVTKQCGTEPPFQNKYWDEKRSGIYVDVNTGEPLFSSLDKFDSGTGWPSFTRSLENASIEEREERTLGVKRIEVRTNASHLGHVFADGPEGGSRYCINSAALRFIPYEELDRQDRKTTSREPITAKLMADLLETAGADRVVVFDLHVDQIQGFFNIPVDNINAMSILARPIKEKGLKDLVVVSTDVGGVIRTRRFAEALGVEMAIIDKRRTAHGVSEVMHVIGEVEGKTAVLVDDIIDTAGSILNAVVALKKQGAKDIYVCATHAVFSKDALTKLGSPDIREVFVTDTIRVAKEKRIAKLKVVTIAPFLAEIIAAIYEGRPMGALVEGRYTSGDLQKG